MSFVGNGGVIPSCAVCLSAIIEPFRTFPVAEVYARTPLERVLNIGTGLPIISRPKSDHERMRQTKRNTGIESCQGTTSLDVQTAAI
jgi:hypothetical protein